MDDYFTRYEHRRPPPPVPYSARRELLWQFLAVVNLTLGGWYIAWRWTGSLNPDALWFAVPLALAETMAFVGLALFTFNLWRTRDTPRRPPPRSYAETIRDPGPDDHRPVAVDVFFPTYSEDPELVRLSLIDAKTLRYPHAIDLRLHVLDDGSREAMRRVAEEEGVAYHTRAGNVGFKAGNMRSAMEATSGDFLVICDADTRPFPTLVEHTLGYFRDPDVAWVQTPQWFYDLPAGRPLPDALRRWIGPPGAWLGRAVEAVVGRVRIGADPFRNDPQMFYDVIQRRRNWCNASFCCGAGSVHRREAVMEAALKSFADDVERETRRVTRDVSDAEIRGALTGAVRREVALETELTPYKFHVSEDIYTSIVLHSDPDRRWRSVFHPWVESRMLSPQDLLSWTIQRFKYAGGTLDIALHDSPVLRRGLDWKQRLMYTTTVWSYLGALWNVVFLASPVLFFLTGVPPVAAYADEFYKHILPFLFMNEVAFMVGAWGVPNWAGKSSYLAFFPVNLRALWTVARGEKVSFPVTPKDIQRGTFARLVWPQIAVIVLTVGGFAFAAVQTALGDGPDRAALIANGFWGLYNVAAMTGMVAAAFYDPDDAADDPDAPAAEPVASRPGAFLQPA